MSEVSSFDLVLVLLWYKYFIKKLNATEINQRHAYLLLEKQKGASHSLQNLEENWSAMIFMPIKTTYRNEVLERRADWSYIQRYMDHNSSHPCQLGWCRSGFPKGHFPWEQHPWVLVPQGEANKIGAQDMRLPSCSTLGCEGREHLPNTCSEGQKW